MRTLLLKIRVPLAHIEPLRSLFGFCLKGGKVNIFIGVTAGGVVLIIEDGNVSENLLQLLISGYLINQTNRA